MNTNSDNGGSMIYYQEARLKEGGRGCPLIATANNGASIGPELGFGYVMGTFHDEQVLLIRTAQGNRSSGFDFRPPSSGKTDPKGAEQNEGLEYRLMVKGVRETLDKIDKVVPGYQGQGYEIAGFCWFQGHKDSGAPKAEYEKHLINLLVGEAMGRAMVRLLRHPHHDAQAGEIPESPQWTEVFDLAADPYEMKNLASDAALSTKLEAELETLIKAVNYTVPPNANQPPPAAKVDK